MRTLLTIFAVVLFSASAAHAQLTQVITGRVVAANNPCDPSATHQLQCTDVFLRSEAVDLGKFEGSVVKVSGTVASVFGCALVDVKSVEDAPVSASLTAIFGFRPGRPVLFTTQAPIGSFVVYVMSTGPGFVPLGPFGAILIDPLTLVVDATPDVSLLGFTVRNYPIPDVPAIVGCTVNTQMVVATIEPELSLELTNPVCFTVVP